MDTTYNVSRLGRSLAPVRLGLSLFGNCCVALLEWHGRQRIRARLFELSDRELHDIGISRGEVDYVASNRSVDPRSVS
jgi:uncharacterized protein YjiS (DUF1127 family)